MTPPYIPAVPRPLALVLLYGPKVAGGLIVVSLLYLWLGVWVPARDKALLERADCAVAMTGALTEASFAAATRDACTEAGILKP